ncbi:YbaB/EbfC family nucleoid-associated protein [Amycolatopsis pithecellobii]|uniref:YbaB/EbfC family DNA-binding protein n=1 Tax=Amycolatopsis pithecellobii TaxID=664692 RepID=A0A6N7ZBJ0_9PSEU|nr:YbaB/EbfC family nucleoid-associated protein [Amycolatopsis pithecellobii]MTD59058.1 YbaB/EbfC family DNA-binding protein [Amycolatopsis pithecellobii]
MSEHRAQVDELLADYRRSRERLASVQRELSAVTASESDPDRLVTATVGARGTLTKLEISEEAYRRYRPAELADAIVRVTAAATARALSEAGEIMAPVLPAGADPLLEGGEVAHARHAAEEGSYEDRNWVTR